MIMAKQNLPAAQTPTSISSSLGKRGPMRVEVPETMQRPEGALVGYHTHSHKHSIFRGQNSRWILGLRTGRFSTDTG